MSNETHYLDIRLGIDFTKIFSPEYIQGVKFMLGVENDDEVIQHFANSVLEDMVGSIKSREGYVGVVGANVLPISTDTPVEPEPEQTSYYPEDTDEVETPVSDVEDDEAQEAQPMLTPELVYDGYFDDLYGELSKDLFNIKAYMGVNIHVYLKEFGTYGATLANEIDEPVHSTNELTLEDKDKDVDYIIEYKDIDGEITYGKRKIKKDDNEGEGE